MTTADAPRIRLEGVSLCYRLPRRRVYSFKEYAIHWLRGDLVYDTLWALQDVSLRVGPGEAVGIVGRNGAGKSTLLKVISKVLKPVRGQVDIRCRVSPLLGLGIGFDFELTGRENIYLNALLLGRVRKEIDEKLDAIIDFSGLGSFVESPIRTYSSGMLARLGFSIATAWTPDVLVLDEVLAVGDATFTRRCDERLKEFLDGGTAVLLVSHSLVAIQNICPRCIWLDSGRVMVDGPSTEVLASYSLAVSESDPTVSQNRLP